MFIVKSIHKKVNNLETGIDITVPKVLRIEAPLGGQSIEYEVLVVTNLPVFKSQIHKEDEVVQFSVQKAYKEMEAFHEKVSKKLPDADLPSVPKGRLSLRHSAEEKQEWLNAFMTFIAKNKEICHSVLFNQFIGINRLKQQKSATEKNVIPSKSDRVELSDVDPSEANSNEAKDDLDSGKGGSGDASGEVCNLFPKMKVRKSSKSDSLDIEEVEQNSVTILKNEAVLPAEDLDLFEEVKQIKEVRNKETQLFETERNRHDSLFHNTNNSADLFRINSPTPGKCVDGESLADSEPSEPEPVPANRPKELGLFEAPSPSEVEEVKVSVDKRFHGRNILEENSLQGNKFGNIFLFQEQDLQLGGITQDDERLFYIPKEEIKKSKANPFLSPSSESTDEDDVDESIEELTSLAVPSAAFVPPMEPVKEVLLRDKEKLERPIPKILPKPEKAPLSENLPRKPQVAQKPPVPSKKPSLPPKPKVAAKPTGVGKGASAEEDLVKGQQNSSAQLNAMDIMQYIEQEQKASGQSTSLFD